MTRDELYQKYNGAIPHSERAMIFHDNYETRFLQCAHVSQYRRAQDILRSLCVWQREGDYPVVIKSRMLNVLSNALFDARCGARKIYDLLVADSISAVIAAPISTT